MDANDRKSLETFDQECAGVFGIISTSRVYRMFSTLLTRNRSVKAILLNNTNIKFSCIHYYKKHIHTNSKGVLTMGIKLRLSVQPRSATWNGGVQQCLCNYSHSSNAHFEAVCLRLLNNFVFAASVVPYTFALGCTCIHRHARQQTCMYTYRRAKTSMSSNFMQVGPCFRKNWAFMAW